MTDHPITKILLIEDNLGDIRLLQEMFNEANHHQFEIHIENKVMDARRYLKVENPDVILLDLSLPDAEGYTTFEQIYGCAEHIPIIVLTGLDNNALALKTLSSGAQDYLMKGKINVDLVTRAIRYSIQRKNLIDKLQHMAFYDGLTDLPNRHLFVDRITMSFFRTVRQKDYMFSVLFLDLDKFKEVNDTFGHSTGDLLLIEVAKRIKICLRPTDTLSRFGGDEFGILLEDLQGVENGVRIAERILEQMKQPFTIENKVIHCTASIGITLNAFGEYENAEEMLRDSDIAMYRAKELGKSCFEIFEPVTRRRLVNRIQLESELRRGIDKKEFLAAYQPIVSLKTGKIVGLEALIRWKHPKRGLLLPAEFIEIAEESGLISSIGEWMLLEACQQIGLWNKKLKRETPLFVSVNLSSKQFADEELVKKISNTLQSIQMDPALLKIEITETAILMNPGTVAQLLSELRTQHVEISLDDFGTGYSSLSHLYQFSIDFLKIDLSFVQKLLAANNASKIVSAMIQLAKALNISVIAEGIDKPLQLERLIEMQCAYGQGYLFSEPLEKEAMQALLIQDPIFLLRS